MFIFLCAMGTGVAIMVVFKNLHLHGICLYSLYIILFKIMSKNKHLLFGNGKKNRMDTMVFEHMGILRFTLT